MWRLEFDEGYFRIFDRKRMLAGYLDPDYGDLGGRRDAGEAIEAMVRERREVFGGTIMVPLVKFCLFDRDLDTDIPGVEANVSRVLGHLAKWAGFLEGEGLHSHRVSISHTDQDMLTVSFAVAFSGPTPLGKALLPEISPLLDRMQGAGLL